MFARLLLAACLALTLGQINVEFPSTGNIGLSQDNVDELKKTNPALSSNDATPTDSDIGTEFHSTGAQPVPTVGGADETDEDADEEAMGLGKCDHLKKRKRKRCLKNLKKQELCSGLVRRKLKKCLRRQEQDPCLSKRGRALRKCRGQQEQGAKPDDGADADADADADDGVGVEFESVGDGGVITQIGGDTTEVEKVCGSDGITYKNFRQLSRAQHRNPRLTVQNNGPCTDTKCQDRCTAEDRPVCGSDGQTYGNICFLELAHCHDQTIQAKHTGACATDPCDRDCGRSYNPVCATDRETYNNTCQLLVGNCKDNSIRLAHHGRCIDTCPDERNCSPFYNPLCGTDGLTYDNYCQIVVANCKDPSISIADNGPCIEDNLCNFACTFENDPVCGTDGKTYSNTCLLRRGNCKDHRIRYSHHGGCVNVCPQNFCPLVNDPVCGSNGVTYQNECLLRKASCQDKTLFAKKRGICVEDPKQCGFACPTIFSPICANDGATYSNLCLLRIANCKDNRIQAAYSGLCQGTTIQCEDRCTAEDNPVCGTDGHTYGNTCFLELARCRGSTVGIAHYGFCQPKLCGVHCTGHGKPVCGSDNKIYTSGCELENAKCNDPGIREVNCPGTSPIIVNKCDYDCDDSYSPLCGTDGVTYHNLCLLREANCKSPSTTRFKAYGGCPSVQPQLCATTCPLAFDPVCGSDGKTYANPCALEIASCHNPSVTQASTGPCDTPTLPPTEPVECPTSCPETSGPVCGTDGTAYDDECQLQIARCKDKSVQLRRVGPCLLSDCPESCPPKYDPYCGTDGKTYTNRCFLRAAVCSNLLQGEASRGRCKTVPQPLHCSSVCPTNFNPICGNDGITYNNLCELSYAICKDGRIQPAYSGPCDGPTQVPRPQPCLVNNCHQKPDDIVCGTDGRTYRNPCELELAKCSDPGVQLSSIGKCPIACPFCATDLIEPVCGSDGNTYLNECLLQLENCKTGTSKAITIARLGKCEVITCEKICGNTYSPVCGSDRYTYGNECYLQNYRCQDETLYVASSGRCRDIISFGVDELFGEEDKNSD